MKRRGARDVAGWAAAHQAIETAISFGAANIERCTGNVAVDGDHSRLCEAIAETVVDWLP